MAEFRLFTLCLFLMLPFTATVTQQYSKEHVRVGGEVTLPCENGRNDNDRCSRTTWLFGASRSKTAVTLFEHGQIHKDAGSKSLRLSVTADCSLVIMKVTAEDEGRYACRQFRSGELVTDSQADLSVTNRQNSVEAKLTSGSSATTRTVITKSSTTSINPTTKKENNTNRVQTNIPVIILAAGFVVFFIILAVIGSRRTKRGKTQRSHENANHAADDVYASIKKTDAQPYLSCTRASSDDNSIYVNIKHI